LNNSSASSMEYMRPLWPKIAATNLNTVLATVSWELLEPEEGRRGECPPDPGRTLQALERVHEPAYVARLKAACDAAPEGDAPAFSLFDSPDNPISAASFAAAYRGTGIALAALAAVLDKRASSVFVASRPPGHHALAAQAMGFCFFNSIAVAARDLVEHWGATRVLVADFDVHHGNGTQQTFWEDGRVAYLSVHRYPFFPGTGATVNVPLKAGAGDGAYAGGFSAALESLATRFRPEFVLVSAGFDAHAADPRGGMRVTTEGFAWMTRSLEEVAETYAGGRIVSILEGGYDAVALGQAAAAHLRVLDRSGGLP